METETERLADENRINFINDCNQTFIDAKVGHRLNFDAWEICYVKLNNKQYDKKYKDPFIFITKKLNENEKLPNLVAWAGVSLGSFCNTTRIIMNNLEDLKKCYQAVYIISLGNIKPIHNACFPCRDAKMKASSIDEDRKLTYNDGINKAKTFDLKKKEENYEWIAFKNKDEISFQEDISYIIDKIVRAKDLKNVHILGKSAGAGIAIHIMDKSEVYTGLFLAVPSSPLNVLLLRDLPKERLKNIKFRFMWIKQDGMVFDWQKDEGINLENESRNLHEKELYDSEMKYIKENLSDNILNYVSNTYEGINEGPNETKTCKPGHHDIHKDFLVNLCN